MIRVTARAPASLVAALRRQSDGTQEQPQHQPRSASGARHTPAMHRMTERVFSHAVKGPLRRCAPLTERTPQRRDPPLQLRKKRLAFACVCGSKCVSRKICSSTGEAVFVHTAQTVAGSRGNALGYDDCTSGPTIFTYVEGNPLIDVDPLGLIKKGPGITTGCANPANAAALAEAGMSPCPSDPALQQEIEKEANRREYKRICNAPPPPGLDQCELAKWNLGKAQACQNAREENTKKWWGGRRQSAQCATCPGLSQCYSECRSRCRESMQMSITFAMTEALSKEIEEAFPLVEMPLDSELSFHNDGCLECDDLRKDIEEYRGKDITGEVIRLVHQEMSLLSAKTWRWLLPYYLKFCLTPEAEHNRMETEFLIYSLAPDLKFQMETLQRLSLLNDRQINCLIHFLEWCSIHEYWKEYCPDDINKALNFVKNILAHQEKGK